MMTNGNNWVITVSKIAVIILAMLLAFHYLLPSINSPEFQQYTRSIGWWGYGIVIGYTILSHVFAPVSGSPGVALGIAIYGIKTGSVLLYLASLVSATINFWIAKKFGRRWVEKLAGQEAMSKIDELAKHDGKGLLVMARLMGFSLFDFFSYAAGLTSIDYRSYMLITVFCTAIPSYIMTQVFRDTDFGSPRGLLIWGASLVTVATIFGIILKIYLKKKKTN